MTRALWPLLLPILGLTVIGDLPGLPKRTGTLPTCSQLLEGFSFRAKGGASEGYTKTCACVSDGAASPTYLWCSTQYAAGAATTTCAGGNATTCP